LQLLFAIVTLRMRIGAVNYLNSKPLVWGLEQLAHESQVRFDLPSRLADSLAAGRLDVALIPTVEFFRSPSYAIVSDACVACDGPVLSVKLHFRVPPSRVRSVALDDGSRTSAALTQILLAELYGVSPRCEPLPIGSGLEATVADAVLLIGDRAVRPAAGTFREVWDLGEVWRKWTGLPFVFAMWIARPGIDTKEVAPLLAAARDGGVQHLDEIAAAATKSLDISREIALSYLRDNLHFTLGPQELEGLARFRELCIEHQLVSHSSASPNIENLRDHGCNVG
jgi:chorismate dehydratase